MINEPDIRVRARASGCESQDKDKDCDGDVIGQAHGVKGEVRTEENKKFDWPRALERQGWLKPC